MLNIFINLETGTVKPSQSAIIKAGGGVPVTVTFSSNPGDAPVIEMALTPQTSSPAVKAYLGSFDAQSDTVYTGTLDANDSRLIALLTGKAAQTLDCEVVVTVPGSERQPFPNFPVQVQPPVIAGPASSEGGPVYVTEAVAAATYATRAQNLADLANTSLARSNLGLASMLCRTEVGVPAGFDASGAAGQYAFDSATSRLWIYIGAQWRYFTLFAA